MVGFDMSQMGGMAIFVLIAAAFWLIPIAAGIWALVTLHRIRSSQAVILLRLEQLERTLQRNAIP